MTENPRPEKVAVVDEVRGKLDHSNAVVLTEYRGLTVSELAELRNALRPSGGEYKVYKNTLVKFAASELGLEINDMLTGPTALAFAIDGDEGQRGDAVSLAKALAEFAKANDKLVIKGGLLAGDLLSADQVRELAKIAPRHELLARLAGGMAAPMQELAGLLKALPQNFAYAMQALIAEGGAPGAPTEEAAEPVAESNDEQASPDQSDTDQTKTEEE